VNKNTQRRSTITLAPVWLAVEQVYGIARYSTEAKPARLAGSYAFLTAL
jgi:hypothetical protein